jgi:hypothetical protein
MKSQKSFEIRDIKIKDAPYDIIVLFADDRHSELYKIVGEWLRNSQNLNIEMTEDEAESYDGSYTSMTDNQGILRYYKYVLSDNTFPYEKNEFIAYVATKKGQVLATALCVKDQNTVTISDVDSHPIHARGKGICKSMIRAISWLCLYTSVTRVYFNIVSSNYMNACICYIDGMASVWNTVYIDPERKKKYFPKNNEDAVKMCDKQHVVHLYFYLSREDLIVSDIFQKL